MIKHNDRDKVIYIRVTAYQANRLNERVKNINESRKARGRKKVSKSQFLRHLIFEEGLD